MMHVRQDVADTLAKCAAYDAAKFPQPSETIIDAWCEHFDLFPTLTRADLLDAVKVYYSTPDRKVPQPADISRIARDRANARPETDEEKALRAKRNDERLGLDTSWYKTPEEMAAIEGAPERARAIREFTEGMSRKAAVPGLNLNPSQAQSPTEGVKVRPRGSQAAKRRR